MAHLQSYRFRTLAFALAVMTPALAFAGKYDKKIAKRAKIAVSAASQLPSAAEERALVDAESDAGKKVKLKQSLRETREKTVERATESIAKLGATDNAKAAKDLIGFGLLPCKNSSIEVDIFDAIQSALAEMNDEKAMAQIKKMMLKSRKFELQMLLVDVCAGSKNEILLEALHEQVQVPAKKVDPRVITAVSKALMKRKDKRSVRPLIKAFDIWKSVGGLTFRSISDALYEMTGRKFTEAADYEAFWDPREATYDPGKVEKEPVGGTVERGAPRIFGSEVVSKRVVIILDVSCSMAWKDAGSNKKDDTPPKTEGTVERGSDEDKKANGNGEYQGPSLGPDMDGYDKVPADRMRLNRAKRQLVNLVSQFPKDTQFNIVKFSAKAGAWKSGKIVAANAGAKKKAIQFVEALAPEYHTMAYLGLEEAFKCKDADTIYFISDGAPTNDQGQPLKQGEMNELVERIIQLNKLRKVQIHSIGMKGAYPYFMKRLSNATGGTYRQVD